MKNVLLGIWLLATLLAGHLAQAQAPTWQSVIAAAVGSTPLVRAVAKDGAGNVFITGTFRGTVTIGGTSLTTTSASAAFVAKWNSSAGNFAWAQQVGAAVAAIAVGNGGVYIAGTIADASATFGNITLVNNSYYWTISNGGGSGIYSEGFVAKLTDTGSAGQFTWVKRIGGLYREHVSALAVAGTSVYVGGRFYSETLLLDGQTLANTASGSAGNTSNLFVAKLTDAGSTAAFEWAQGAGPRLANSTSANYINSLAVVGSSIYAVGHSDTNVAFGNSAVVVSGATQGGLVAKLTDAGSAGSFGWARRVGQGEFDYCNQVAASGNSVYVVGDFSSAQLTLDNTTIANTVTVGTTNMFATKLTDAGTTGNFVWGQQMGGTSWNTGRALAVQGNDIYVAGAFTGSVNVGGTTLVSNGNYDALVVRLLDTGPTASVQWAQQAGGTGSDTADALVLVGGTLYVAGQVAPPATFGSLTLAPAASSSAVYLATLAAVPLANVGPAAAQPGFEVFPNPARTVATVRVPGGTGAATLTLTDALGRMVRTQSAITGKDYRYDLGGLAPGVYALRVQAGAAVATQKLVVE
jgi:hypothetical protein